MTVKSIHIYPIKGLGGVELLHSQALERGMQYDRRWMLVDEEGIFMTQRTRKDMALFRCRMDKELEVAFRDNKISIPLNEYSDHKVLTTVWDNVVYAYEVSENISQWFTDQLKTPCRLVRMVDGHDIYKKLIKGPAETKVSFADGYPFLVIGTASLEHLSDKLNTTINSNRFRPNIIIETSTPHEEDTWDYVTIGSTKLQIIKPCSRCLVINIDQSTAKIMKEPLKTLSTYRTVDNVVYFGANAICIEEGSIKVDDEVRV